ncbi:poly(hydroxyalcanoate) granule associated protein [Acinetobacter sp. ANC 4558]|nr:poly(hydroxyalcanoate) granule associated protein [Acinetobacter sp. ANC 4558]
MKNICIQIKKSRECNVVEYGNSKLDFKKYTKQIWLAGLGAFSKAEEEGSKLFETLVQTGSELEAKSKEISNYDTNEISKKTKSSVIETKDKIEKLVEYGIYQSLSKMGLVTVKDLQKLEKMILELHQKIDIILEENNEIKNNIQQK